MKSERAVEEKNLLKNLATDFLVSARTGLDTHEDTYDSRWQMNFAELSTIFLRQLLSRTNYGL
jgi:hypothetical protein